MPTYYYTFGSNGDGSHPYTGGWVEVIARGPGEADEKFRKRFPDKRGNGKFQPCLNCAERREHFEMYQSEMLKNGNLGAFCHEVIE